MDALRRRVVQLESSAASVTPTSMTLPLPTAPGAPSPPAPPLTIPDEGRLSADDAAPGEGSVNLSLTTTAVVEPDEVAPAGSSCIGGHSVQVVRQQLTSMPPQQHAQHAGPGSASAGDDPANVLLDDSSALLDGAHGETQEPTAGADRGSDQTPLGPCGHLAFEDVFVDVDVTAHDDDVNWVDLGTARQIASKADGRPLTFDDVLAIIDAAVRADDAEWVDLDPQDESDSFADRVFDDLIEYIRRN